jgi:hypothetical protein
MGNLHLCILGILRTEFLPVPPTLNGWNLSSAGDGWLEALPIPRREPKKSVQRIDKLPSEGADRQGVSTCGGRLVLKCVEMTLSQNFEVLQIARLIHPLRLFFEFSGHAREYLFDSLVALFEITG